ncbi:glycosyltransferase [Saccharomonospora sp. NPDC046836]|uniref:glycosyltransferase n=1 Tax=Saccharomonospora sp. NPDC046836 TaxID=3156921 RepID=UPI0033C85192
MKIAMVSENASPLTPLGGQNVHVAELSTGLARAGHDVTVYTRQNGTDQPAVVRAPAGYRVVHVPAGPLRQSTAEPPPHLGEFTTFLERQWRTGRPDVVHAHFWMSGLASVLAARALDVPVVQTFHTLGVVKRRQQSVEDAGPPERMRLERLIGRQAARVVATCSDEVFELVRMGVARSRVSVVPGGVDIERFTPGGKPARRGPHHRIAAVGRLVPRKGFDIAIAALPALPGTELVVAGGPEPGRLAEDAEARRLLRYADRLGVADRVRLVGQVGRADMPALLRSADAVVCTAWYEPSGLVPLEAMACGVPVVAAAVGGLTDAVVDGVTGTLVPPKRPDAVAAAVRTLLADPALRDAYGIAGSDRARCRYSWDRIADDTYRVYQRTMPAPVIGTETG